MKRNYRIGVIGLGARAETFVRQLHEERGRTELFGVCDIDTDRTEKFLNYCGIDDTRTFDNPETFMKQDGMDAVIITTPDFCHYEVAQLAFENNKHTYLDKPLEASAERCRAIIAAHRKHPEVTAFVGFNLRASQGREKIKELVNSGAIGQLIHIDQLEQTSSSHCASFRRRFHRFNRQSGGWLNTKCCHDLDIMLWTVGHQHKVIKVSSFGGTNIFKTEKMPAEHCSECPHEIYEQCLYRDKAGFVFPVGGKDPIHKTQDLATYGGDLCAYNKEAELLDNQTVILEWEHGVRGSFNLQGFQLSGRRETRIWGEHGTITTNPHLQLISSRTGETASFSFKKRSGGHGGLDPLMIGRFINAIESEGASDSGLAEGLAATLLAEKALESQQKGEVVHIRPDEYEA